METPLEAPTEEEQTRRIYRAIWRWHFYAGVLCIPLVIWLACTGSIYLFKPQIERLLDRPYDHLRLEARRATPEQIANAAVSAVSGSVLHYYELPVHPDSANQVIVGVSREEYRVYVEPTNLRILKIANEDDRPMRILSRLHGELFAGDWGSRIVELAASWAIVLIVSGLYLWWPRQSQHLAGVLWIRLRKGQRIFWRDLHAVTGLWISAFALFLLLTGLPWAKGWGTYFKAMRKLASASAVKQDWTIGRSSEIAEREAMTRNLSPSEAEHADHMGHVMPRITKTDAYSALNTLVPAAARLRLAYPVMIMPAMQANGSWTVKSDAQNRTLRTIVMMDPNSGVVISREDFHQRHLLDRIVGVGVAAHEGQLFGLVNQILGLFTAMGLVALCVSAVILWWRRRNVGVLGAPIPMAEPRWPGLLVATVILLAIYLPEMGISLIVVYLLERFLLRRIPSVRSWLGLRTEIAGNAS
jgi:uncharacterized iron-regulated membrane protein